MSNIFQKGNKNVQKGFSLVELMVSLSIFAIVMTISTGTLLVLIDMNAKAQAIYSATSNISFALDSMSRGIRTGYDYYCTQATQTNLPDGNRDCPVGAGPESITFTREKDGNRIGYRLENNRIQTREEESDGTLVQSWTEITAPDVFIETFDIVVENSNTFVDSSNTNQPTVDLVIKGYVNNGLDTNTDFNIQTRMVGRRLDVI